MKTMATRATTNSSTAASAAATTTTTTTVLDNRARPIVATPRSGGRANKFRPRPPSARRHRNQQQQYPHQHQYQQQQQLWQRAEGAYCGANEKSLQVEESFGARVEEPTRSSCDSFTVNSQTIDFKLRWVERCLVQLVREETIREELDDASGSGAKAIERKIRFDRDRLRIKTMLQIYAKLLRNPPPMEPIVRLPLGAPPGRCVQEARQQVLSLIERLAGYCDSIHCLRCTLKSGHMIAVISAFDAVLERIREIGSQACQFVPPVEDSHEFRIVQEWKF